MIRQSAFVTKRRLLKGALHCHTTRSDGSGTPEDVIRLHKEHGYDFMALTDHNNYNYAHYGDTPMLIIPGMERQFHLLENGEKHDRNFHSVCIGPLKEDGNGYEQDQRFDEPRILDQHELQPYLDEIHRNGNMTVLCHPPVEQHLSPRLLRPGRALRPGALQRSHGAGSRY